MRANREREEEEERGRYLERVVQASHFVDDHSEGPNVTFVVVGLPLAQLRAEVINIHN